MAGSKKYEHPGTANPEATPQHGSSAFMSVKSGMLHTTVLMWGYDNLADREARRAAMYADPEWQTFISEVWKLDAIQKQDVMIMNPAPFSRRTFLDAKGRRLIGHRNRGDAAGWVNGRQSTQHEECTECLTTNGLPACYLAMLDSTDCFS